MKQDLAKQMLETTGMSAKDGRGLVRAIPAREWLRPAQITLERDCLVYSFVPGLRVENMGEEVSLPYPVSVSLVSPDASIFDNFLKLADAPPSEILTYAQRYGVLELCEHHLPRTHWDVLVPYPASTIRPVCRPIPGNPGYCEEPIQDWKNLAGGLRAVLHLAAHLHQDQPAPLRVWEVICSMGTGTQPLLADVQQCESKAPKERLAIHRGHLNTVVNWLLQVANVQPWFWWSDTGAGVEFGSGLFGHLILQLVLAVSRKDGFAFCTECGKEYLITRRPAQNRNNYCPICRKAGVPGRKAALRYWRKTGSRNRKNKAIRPRHDARSECLEEAWPSEGIGKD